MPQGSQTPPSVDLRLSLRRGVLQPGSCASAGSAGPSVLHAAGIIAAPIGVGCGRKEGAKQSSREQGTCRGGGGEGADAAPPPSPPSPPRSSEGRGEDSRTECFKAPAPRATQTPAEGTPATTVITIVTNTFYLHEASQHTRGTFVAILQVWKLRHRGIQRFSQNPKLGRNKRQVGPGSPPTRHRPSEGPSATPLGVKEGDRWVPEEFEKAGQSLPAQPLSLFSVEPGRWCFCGAVSPSSGSMRDSDQSPACPEGRSPLPFTS